MNLKNGKVHPQGIIVNAGEVIANNVTHGKPVATLIVYGPNNVQMKYIDDITKEKNVWFAISGFGVYPTITATKEGFVGTFSDVLRSANRPIIGYRKKDNKIVIAVRSSSTAERAQQTAKNLGLDFAISLDGGGSTTLKVKGKYKFKGDGRKIFGGIIWS
jgi:exopolysaccharide biosynthesis protein